jgi:hypothetical protein
MLTGNQLSQLLRAWLSPADPSTNHNLAQKAQFKGTAVWFFQGGVIIEWKSTGSLLWIYGKRAFLSPFSGSRPSSRLLMDSDFWQLDQGKASSGSLFNFLAYSRS